LAVYGPGALGPTGAGLAAAPPVDAAGAAEPAPEPTAAAAPGLALAAVLVVVAIVGAGDAELPPPQAARTRLAPTAAAGKSLMLITV